MTSLINSLYNLIIFTLCWRRAAPRELKGKYFEVVRLVTYGDDNIQGFDRGFSDFWNYATIATHMKSIGMTYTTEDKVSDVWTAANKRLVDCTFLKRGFNVVNASVLTVSAPLDIKSVLNMSYFIDNPKLKRQIMAQNLEFMLRELSLHPAAVWQQYAATIAREFYSEYELMPENELNQRVYFLIVSEADEFWIGVRAFVPIVDR
jgi:hypothetical protein